MGRYDFLLSEETKRPEQPPKQQPAAQPPPTGVQTDSVRGVPLVPLVPPVPLGPRTPRTGSTGKRQSKEGRRVIRQRHPFDIYQDQYVTLQQLALEERMRGGIGSMSAMVREAIDDLITKRRHT